MDTNTSVQAAAKKSSLELLKALRNKIADEIDDGVAARDLAALSRRLLEIAEQITTLEAESKDDEVSTAAATPDESW